MFFELRNTMLDGGSGNGAWDRGEFEWMSFCEDWDWD